MYQELDRIEITEYSKEYRSIERKLKSTRLPETARQELEERLYTVDTILRHEYNYAIKPR